MSPSLCRAGACSQLLDPHQRCRWAETTHLVGWPAGMCPDLTAPDLKMPKRPITFVRKTTPQMEVSLSLRDRCGSAAASNRLELPEGRVAASVLCWNATLRRELRRRERCLRWVQTCTSLAAKKETPVRLEAKDLEYQSSALLAQASAPGCAAYVPMLSKDFYEKRVSRLMAVGPIVRSGTDKTGSAQRCGRRRGQF
jgi:hypothetical protein